MKRPLCGHGDNAASSGRRGRLLFQSFLLLTAIFPHLISPVASQATAQDAVAETWPAYQYHSDHNAVFPSPLRRVSWSTRLGGQVNGALAIVENRIYLVAFDHRAYALDANTGQIAWSSVLENVGMSGAVVGDGLVFFGTGTSRVLVDSYDTVLWGRPEGDELVALDLATGEQRWRIPTVGENMPTPALIQSQGRKQLLFSNGDGHVRAVDPRTGTVLWQRTMLGVSSMSSLAITNDGSVVGLSNLGVAYYLAEEHDPRKLRYRGHTWLMQPDGQFRWTAALGNSDCSPTVADGTIFIESDRRTHFLSTGDWDSYNTVSALDARTGQERWAFSGGSGAPPLVGSKEFSVAGMYTDGTLYQSLPFDRTFVALDAKSGRLRWKIHTIGSVKMSAVKKDGLLYFGDDSGTFYVVSASQGEIIAEHHFGSFFTSSPPVIQGQTIFIAHNDTLRAIPLETLATK